MIEMKNQVELQRILGSYTQGEPGPLLIVFGAMHGNEPAGVKALDLMFKMLEVEPILNPDFTYKGKVIGLIGNQRAHQQEKRYINRDLNRQWTAENIHCIDSWPTEKLNEEQKEIAEIRKIVLKEMANTNPTKLIVLDLHTTSGKGGIFSIATDDTESLDIAIGLHAPVVKGMLKGLRGTTLHHFTKANYNIDTTAITFESGQHYEPLSINRAIAAITNCMRAIGSVDAAHIVNTHDRLLQKHSENLPKVTKLIYRHAIEVEDGFKMKEGFHNFQRLRKGTVIAEDKNGDILVPEDSLLLMPLYQKLGEDGFFLIKEIQR